MKKLLKKVFVVRERLKRLDDFLEHREITIERLSKEKGIGVTLIVTGVVWVISLITKEQVAPEVENYITAIVTALAGLAIWIQRRRNETEK